jgi:TonB family protein
MRPLMTMTESALRLAADHLWQSSLVIMGAAVLVLLGRRWPASWRHAIWLASSIKFLVPFAVLVAIGGAIPLPAVDDPGAPSALSTVLAIGAPFSASQPPLPVVAAPRVRAPRAWWPLGLGLVWMTGASVFLVSRLRKHQRAARLVRESWPLVEGREVDAWRRLSRHNPWAARVRLRGSSARVSPCVIGAWRPVLIWPSGVSAELSDTQLESIFIHELAHVERRDNLTSTMHAAVEIVFWYHPLVWVAGARLAAERERACDEAVLAQGTARVAYADGILRAAAFALPTGESGSPIIGSPLVQRIEAIMTSDLTPRFRSWQRAALLVAAACLVLTPIALGAIEARDDRGRVAMLGDAPTLVSFDVDEVMRAMARAEAPVPRATPAPVPPRATDRSSSTPPASQQGSAIIPAVVGPPTVPQGPGKVAGTITDPMGLRLPGVTVTLVVRASGAVAHTSVTNAKGEYGMAGVMPGDYDLQARLAAFRAFGTSIAMRPGAAVTMAVSLQIGAVTETVTIMSHTQPPVAESEPMAEAELLDAIARNPDGGQPYLDRLALLYYRQERLIESAAVVDRALALADLQLVELPTRAPSQLRGVVTVGGSIREPRKVRDVKPLYPGAAASGGTSGIVILEARIAPDGTVRDARVLRGAPILAASALGAVRQWQYRPTLLNGVPVDVAMTVTVNFAGQ